jgi:hypothetical protein
MLDHPNIVKVYEILETHVIHKGKKVDTDTYYIVTGYLPGDELLSRIFYNKGCNEANAAEIVE